MNALETIRVYLIDDEAMIRAGLRALLDMEDGIEVIGDTGDAREGIRAVKEQRPDVVLLDITMPGLSGLDCIRPLKEAAPKSKVLMASQLSGFTHVEQALQAGADGYLTKSSDPSELAVAIRSIHSGESYLSPKVASALIQRVRQDNPDSSPALASLTAREREVFQLLATGKANKEVAAALHISVGTVKKHRENLQRKLDCHSPAELARLAIREGLLSL